MYSDYFAYPMVADAGYSPIDDLFYCQNLFDQAYPIGLQRHPSIEHPAGWEYCPVNYPTQPLYQYGQSCASSFETVPTFDLDMPSASNTGLYSASPLSSDSSQPLHPPLSTPLSECNTSKEATSSNEESAPRKAQRKRGRARLHRNLPGAKLVPSINACSLGQHQRAPRQPHRQVERKYRDNLNSDLERLRRAVPTLCQSEEGSAIGRPRPSKAMVLSCAIDYIAKIELERDGLQEGNKLLGGTMWRS
ncbi:hypothetical protein IQ06DRAFT_294112 [Phaeosphaeriaceae sp. SRC1lsM3a]|nr:hypothetical protein IQ06DRAFT_294112 [Stagonospora sp. SRC1lsM3a]